MLIKLIKKFLNIYFCEVYVTNLPVPQALCFKKCMGIFFFFSFLLALMNTDLSSLFTISVLSAGLFAYPIYLWNCWISLCQFKILRVSVLVCEQTLSRVTSGRVCFDVLIEIIILSCSAIVVVRMSIFFITFFLLLSESYINWFVWKFRLLFISQSLI